MEINLSPDALKKWGAVILVILALLGGGYTLNASGIFSREAIPEEETNLGGIAAVAGVEAAFTLDHEEPIEDWLARLCEVSTEESCQVSEIFLMDSMLSILETKQPKTTCSAEYIEKVDSGVQTDGVGDDEKVVYEWEVWKVNFTLSDPWEGAEGEDTVFVQVNNEEGEWKFARILFEQEVEKYTSDEEASSEDE
jgi:hypothetical protein